MQIYKYLCRYVHGEGDIRRPSCDRGNYVAYTSPVGECHEEGRWIVGPARTESIEDSEGM